MSADHAAAVYAMLIHAAESGALAPRNADITAALGFSSVSVGARCVATLERQKLISVARFNAGRVITITESGISTATPRNRTPHWRDCLEPKPSVQLRPASSLNKVQTESSETAARSDLGYAYQLAAVGTPTECDVRPVGAGTPEFSPDTTPHKPVSNAGRGVSVQPRWRMSVWLHAARGRPKPRRINTSLTQADKCQWIENDSWPFAYCGAERAGRLPYCTAHADRAYIKEDAEDSRDGDPLEIALSQ